MTAIVIGMEAAGRTRQGIAPAQPCATRDSAQIEPTCVTGSLLFKTHCKPGAREVVTVRIRVGSGRAHRCIHRVPQAHELARIQFQSAHASRAVTAGVLSVISAPTSAFFAIFNAYRAACDLADRAYENERAKHAPDTALVRFADAVAGKTTEKEEAK